MRLALYIVVYGIVSTAAGFYAGDVVATALGFIAATIVAILVNNLMKETPHDTEENG